MPSNPKVSVIIPVYNREELLLSLLEKLVRQTCQNFEVIIVDDGSDSPIDLNNRSNGLRIKLISLNINMGPGYCRNIGMQNAAGIYISFLDSDDYWDKNFIRCTTNALDKNSNAVMAYTNGFEVNAKGRIVGYRRDQIFTDSNILPTIFKKGRPWGTGGCLWRAEIIKEHGNWIDARAWEDYAFDTIIGTVNNEIISIERPLIFYSSQGVDKMSNKSYDNILRDKFKSVLFIANILHENKSIESFKSIPYFSYNVFGFAAQSASIRNRKLLRRYCRILYNLDYLNRIELYLIAVMPLRISKKVLRKIRELRITR